MFSMVELLELLNQFLFKLYTQPSLTLRYQSQPPNNFHVSEGHMIVLLMAMWKADFFLDVELSNYNEAI